MLSAREKWDQLAARWYEHGPPSTPSRMDVDIYRRTLRAERAQSVMTLGCTPALRHLAGAELGVSRLVVVDFSSEMYRRTSELVSPTWGEDFVNVDWCDGEWEVIPPVDVVLGDRALDNVPLAQRRAFFAAIRRQCRSEGLFVCHTGLDACQLADASSDALVEQWTAEWYSGTSLQDCVDGLWDDLLASRGKRTQQGAILSVEALWPHLTQIANHSRVSSGRATLVRELQRQYRESKTAEWYATTLEQSVKSAHPHFVLERLALSHDYQAADHHPFLMLRVSG